MVKIQEWFPSDLIPVLIGTFLWGAFVLGRAPSVTPVPAGARSGRPMIPFSRVLRLMLRGGCRRTCSIVTGNLCSVGLDREGGSE
jgi:hypothetical protein